MNGMRGILLLAVLGTSAAWSDAWSWSELEAPGAPSKRQGHAAVEVGRKIYIIGGCLQEIRCFNDVHVFDTGTRQWSEESFAGPAPVPRGGHTATLVGSDIFVIGGANSEATFSDVHRLDLLRRTWTRLTNSREGLRMSNRTSHAAAADARRVYVFGGYDADGAFLNDLWVLHASPSPPFTPDAPEAILEEVPAVWARPVPVGEAPSPREGHSLTLLDRQLLLFGGRGAEAELNDLHAYDILQQRWKPLEASGTKPLPRQAHSAQRHGLQLVVAGGCAARCFGDVWSFDAQATRWTLRSSEPGVWKQREGHAAAFVGGQMFTFGGCQLSECFNDVSVLETSEPCPEQCGGHGQCVDGLCQCTTPGFTGHDCLQPLSCHQDCGMHGACGHDGQCACSGGFSGARCHLPPVCPGQPLPCSGRGQCLSDGTCRCQAGADGADCFADAKNHSAGAEVRPLQHWAQGLLSLAVPKEPSTQHKKWMRVSASDFGIDKVNEDGHVDAANPDCEDNCHWRGLCDAGVCFCQPGFSGRTCSIAKENTDGTVNIVYTGAMAGVGFLASLGTTLVLLQAQQRQKRQKDTEAGYVG